MRLRDGTVWQSSNEGYTWWQPIPDERFVVFYLHTHSHDRGYLLTASKKFYYTTDTGRSWNHQTAPNPPNTFGAIILHFQPNTEYLIWTGNADCEGNGGQCHAEAHYSTDNGRKWYSIESYVRNCAWARDKELLIDRTQIICESYKEKKGDQRTFNVNVNPLQLVTGTQFFSHKKVLFDRVVGFAKFSEFLIVAEVSDCLLMAQLLSEPPNSILSNNSLLTSKCRWTGRTLLLASSRQVSDPKITYVSPVSS